MSYPYETPPIDALVKYRYKKLHAILDNKGRDGHYHCPYCRKHIDLDWKCPYCDGVNPSFRLARGWWDSRITKAVSGGCKDCGKHPSVLVCPHCEAGIYMFSGMSTYGDPDMPAYTFPRTYGKGREPQPNKYEQEARELSAEVASLRRSLQHIEAQLDETIASNQELRQKLAQYEKKHPVLSKADELTDLINELNTRADKLEDERAISVINTIKARLLENLQQDF